LPHFHASRRRHAGYRAPAFAITPPRRHFFASHLFQSRRVDAAAEIFALLLH